MKRLKGNSSYGLPYQGSKNCIAPWIMELLPAADTFVDLFFGGGALTHTAILSGKWRRFVANDIKGEMPRMFVDAIEGKYRDERRWISRDDFFRLKDTDLYARLCFSFGNDSRSYAYGKEKEADKEAAHRAVADGDWRLMAALFPDTWKTIRQALDGAEGLDNRRIAFCRAAGGIYKKGLQHLESLSLIQHLESLSRIQHLESLSRTQPQIETLALSYDEVPLPADATVIADPPYRGTKGYGSPFDHERFYDWLRRVERPVYVCEYAMPDDFACVAEKRSTSLMCANSVKDVKERVFLHRRWT